MADFLIILAFGTLIAIIPCLLVWRLTKKLPIWLRLLITTFLFALLGSPIVAGSEGGGGIFPLGLILFFNLPDLFFGGGDNGLGTQLSALAFTFLCVWGVTYFISMIVVGV